MQLHQLQPKTVRKTAKRIGRGGKRGKTSGRGGKGQTARAGGAPRPEMRDTIKRIPKLRGFGKNRARTVNSERMLPTIINVSTLEKILPKGGAVSPKILVGLGVVVKLKGKVPAVKILGTGSVTQKFTVSGCTLSMSAKAKIADAGGSVA